MKKIVFIFTALLMLASCSKGYKVTVTFPDESANGETAFLTNYDTRTTPAPLRALPTRASSPACMLVATLTASLWSLER